MKAFLDTSVLIASFYDDHEGHRQSAELLVRFPKSEAACSAHSLLEVYSSLTGMPGNRRVSPDEAMLFLADIRERLTIVALTENDYEELLESSATVRVTGGAIYDSQIAHCAQKVKADTLYTWDLGDFQRVAPKSLRVARPPNPEQAG